MDNNTVTTAKNNRFVKNIFSFFLSESPPADALGWIATSRWFRCVGGKFFFGGGDSDFVGGGIV